jgi:predicted TPR repeat methyltransferase
LPADDAIEQAQALLEEGAALEAAAALKPLIESGRAGLLARATYARALGAAGESATAIETARETALLFPGVALAALVLGEALLAEGQLPTAIAEFQRALRIDPALEGARYMLGCAWLEAGEPDNALREFELAAAGENASSQLADRIAEARRMREAPRSNPRYVRHLFDQFSGDYDSRMLGQLGYAAPRILREFAALVMPAVENHSVSILDLGCGTGLAGIAFRDLAAVLDGVDLSPAMIAKAHERAIYRTVEVGDIEDLGKSHETYDIVLAADTLVYLGALDTVFDSVGAVLVPDGLFLFTIEEHVGSGFELGPKRRWRHSEAYLRDAAAQSGFEVRAIITCSPRTEAAVPVPGLAVALQRSGRPTVSKIGLK